MSRDATGWLRSDRQRAEDATDLLAVVMAIFAVHDDQEILRLTGAAVGELGPCRAEAAYLERDGELVRCWAGRADPDPTLDAQVRALDGEDGPVQLRDRSWAWAYRVPGDSGHRACLVVSAAAAPPHSSRVLLRMLAQHAGNAMVAGHLLHDREDAEADLRTLNEQLSVANDHLADTVAGLRGQIRIHELLLKASARGEGEEGIAAVVHQLTGLAVAVEDRFGNLRAWAGPGRPRPYPKLDERRRAEVLGDAERRVRPVRDRERVVALARPRDEVLGVLVLVDPARTAGETELLALEHGADMLALEMAHQRSLAEVELRLRRDLVDDLITGTDEESAFARSEAVGHDLHRPHSVAVVQWRGRATDDMVAHAVDRSAARLAMPSLSARRAGMVVLLVDGRPQGEALHEAVAKELGTPTGAIGIGGRCETPAEFPRSFQQALQALKIRQMSRQPDGVTAFEELGIYRILGIGGGSRELELFVWEWLGPLLDYDAKRHADLVHTLSQYLECGGNYDATAEALVIHRSTLRYRLQRIREITGIDLNDVDSRFNLHAATRAWKVIQGSL